MKSSEHPIYQVSPGQFIRELDVFEPRTVTESELLSYIIFFHTATVILLSIFSLVQTISWERPLSWHAKCLIPVSVRGSENVACLTSLLLRVSLPWRDYNFLRFLCGPEGALRFTILFVDRVCHACSSTQTWNCGRTSLSVANTIEIYKQDGTFQACVVLRSGVHESRIFVL